MCGVPVEGRRERCLSGGDGGAMWAEKAGLGSGGPARRRSGALICRQMQVWRLVSIYPLWPILWIHPMVYTRFNAFYCRYPGLFFYQSSTPTNLAPLPFLT